MGFVYLDNCIIKLEDIIRVSKIDHHKCLIETNKNINYVSEYSLTKISELMKEAESK